MVDKGTLHILATPLGNLGDLSARARATLTDVDLLYAEDTRRARVLLSHIGCERGVFSLNAHNEEQRRNAVLEALAADKSVALVSDAGTPAVSDPGAHLVAAVHEAGFKVVPVAGPSALTAALSAAGFGGRAARNILFLGFLPTKGQERVKALDQALAHPGIVVFFEAPHRAASALEVLCQRDPERLACMCREMTKTHEEFLRGTLAEIQERIDGGILGELTMVLGPREGVDDAAPDDDRIDAALLRCLRAGMSPSDSARAVGVVLNVPKRRAYARAVRLQS